MGDVGAGGYEESDAVVEDDGAEGQCRVVGDGEGGDEVDCATAECGAGGVVVRVRRDGDAGVGAEDADRDGAAEVGVEGGTRAVIVDGGVLGGFDVGGAAEGLGLADVVECGCEGW